ncbi:MAG TPA: HEAT repeat domain-containing protein [bacterium]|nr:HEAT repeat domain-containing protein [bacterium]
MSKVRSAALLWALTLASAAIFLPARAQAQEEDTQAKIRTSIQTMVTAIEEGNDPMRNRMFFELRIIGNESVPALVDLMKDSRVKVREYAVHTVSYIDDPRWIDPVIGILEKDPEASTRAMACRALARTQDTPVLEQDGRKAIEPLIKALENDEEAVQMDAAFALGWFGDPKARPHLETAAQSSSELVSFFAKGALEDLDHAEKMRQKSQ